MTIGRPHDIAETAHETQDSANQGSCVMSSVRVRCCLTLLSTFLFALLAPFAAQARVNVRIDLSSQTMTVMDARGGVHRWAISSGRSGYRTPTGVYSANRLARMHYSRKYDNSPMPHSIFFNGGYAIHGTGATRLLGRPASHGCIRLAPGNAAKLFSMVRQGGALISIVGDFSGDGRAYASAKKKRTLAQADTPNTSPATMKSRATGGAIGASGFGDAPTSFWTIDGGRGAPQWKLR